MGKRVASYLTWVNVLTQAQVPEYTETRHTSYLAPDLMPHDTDETESTKPTWGSMLLLPLGPPKCSFPESLTWKT